jgi:quercetin dioxygenase-like cupin family protein
VSLNQPVLTGPGAGRTVTNASGSSAELKLDSRQAGGAWAVVEWHLRAGDEPPIHTHTREDETVYVLDGSITAFVGDQRIELEPGSYAALPKDVPHGLTVRGDEARLLVTLEPAGAEYFFVPRDERDTDPRRFGIVSHDPAGKLTSNSTVGATLEADTEKLELIDPRNLVYETPPDTSAPPGSIRTRCRRS